MPSMPVREANQRAAEIVSQAPDDEVGVGQVVMLPVDALHPADDNPRGEVGDVAQLAASIVAVGLLQPLLVTPRAEGGWTVVAGHRRLAALHAADQAHAACVVRTLDDTQRQEAMLVENIQREDLTALEEARAYQRLIGLGSSQRRIAARVGCNQSHVSKRLALLTLTPAAAAALDAGSITVADAVALAKLRDDPATVDHLVTRGWGNIAAQVDRELDERRRRTARAESIAQHRDPFTVMQHRDHMAGLVGVDGRVDGQVSMVAAQRPQLGVIGQRPDAAAVVEVDDPPAIGAQCTDLASHPQGRQLLEPIAVKDEPNSLDRTATRETNARVREAQERREPLLRRLLDLASDVDQLAHVARISVLACRGNSTYQRNKIACALLGLQVETNDWGSADPDGTLQRHAAAGDDDAQRLRTALAIALAEGERVPRLWRASDGGGWRDETTAAHFAHLGVHGHTCTPTETELLTGAGAPLIDVLAGYDDDQVDDVDAEAGE